MISLYYFLLGCLSFGLLIIMRIFVVVFITLKECRTRPKRLAQDQIKTVIVIGSGGHTTEMMHVVEALNPTRYSPRLYIMATSDTWSEHRINEYETKLKEEGSDNKYEVYKIPRSRSVHQSYFTSVFTTLYSTAAAFPLLLCFNPEMVLCNGPGTCIPICVIAFLLRCCFLSNNTIIFVESICRVKTMSLSGKILHWFADEILVQWPELKEKYSRAKYIGQVA